MAEQEVINSLVERCKREILQDIDNGIVPETVSSFSELHDYVDANCYGGFCDDDEDYDDDNEEIWENQMELVNTVQCLVDVWLKTERIIITHYPGNGHVLEHGDRPGVGDSL